MNAIAQLEGLGKRFGPVVALNDVSMDIVAGEVHALMGENGAGKSTLIKILAGIHPHTSGIVRIDDEPVRLGGPQDARRHGVRTVFQELSIVPMLSVAENIVLGEPPGSRAFVNRAETRRAAADSLALLDVDLDLDQPAGELARSEQQLIEIARSLRHDPRILILDEPTASLGQEESDTLLTIVDTLRKRGVAIIYVSHRMAEVLKIADRVTVLRDGQFIETMSRPLVEDSIVELMTGRSLEALYQHAAREPGEEVLRLEGLRTRSLNGVDFSVRRGEIVGVAGLIGCGKSDLGRAVFGLESLEGGRIVLAGREIRASSPGRMLRQGIVYYPSDRRREGLVPMRPIRESMTLGAHRARGLSRFGLIRLRAERMLSDRLAASLDMRPKVVNRPARAYSGGNQQKAVLARGALRDVEVHIFDEPTVGIDVAAKADVYRLMGEYADGGHGVVVISSDLTELLGISDRVYVVADGQISACLTGPEVNEEAIGRAMFGLPAVTTQETKEAAR